MFKEKHYDEVLIDKKKQDWLILKIVNLSH